MHIPLANGVLTTDHASASFKHPVFIVNTIAYRASDRFDRGETHPAATRFIAAEDLVAEAYAAEIDQGRRFSTAEYNLVARFSGMPLANYCSGE